jgi:hypothetical protein
VKGRKRKVKGQKRKEKEKDRENIEQKARILPHSSVQFFILRNIYTYKK